MFGKIELIGNFKRTNKGYNIVLTDGGTLKIRCESDLKISSTEAKETIKVTKTDWANIIKLILDEPTEIIYVSKLSNKEKQALLDNWNKSKPSSITELDKLLFDKPKVYKGCFMTNEIKYLFDKNGKQVVNPDCNEPYRFNATGHYYFKTSDGDIKQFDPMRIKSIKAKNTNWILK